MTGRGVAGLVVAFTVGAAIAVGLALMGSPTEARLGHLDARRVSDLAEIARGLDVFWSRRDALPASLEELTAELGREAPLHDPESGDPYGYRALDGNRYELCATFATESHAEPLEPEARYWMHAAGLLCFEAAAETAGREPGRRPGSPERGRGR